MLSNPPERLGKARLALGFPDGIGAPESFSGGDPATARGGATGLRAKAEGFDPFGESLYDWAVQQRIVPRRSETA
jgi:hypothetical protein